MKKLSPVAYIETALPLVLFWLASLFTYLPFQWLPFQLLFSQTFMPLIALFYLTLFWKESLPIWGIFVIGILQDALCGSAFGYHAILYLGFYWIVVTQARFFLQKPYSMLLAGFAFSTFVVMVLTYGVEYFIYHRTIPLMTLLLEGLTVVGLYTPGHFLLSAIHRAVKQEGDYGY